MLKLLLLGLAVKKQLEPLGRGMANAKRIIPAEDTGIRVHVLQLTAFITQGPSVALGALRFAGGRRSRASETVRCRTARLQIEFSTLFSLCST